VDIESMVKDVAGVAKAVIAAEKKGWKIAYLATSADRPLGFRKQRTLRQQMNVLAPIGPVLGRKTFYQSTSAADARQQVLADLKRIVGGPLVYVAADGGIKIWTVASVDALTGPLAVEDWSELNAALPQ
jgi:hypothetical protein